VAMSRQGTGEATIRGEEDYKGVSGGFVIRGERKYDALFFTAYCLKRFEMVFGSGGV